MKKKSLLVVILLVVIGICGWGYYQSTPATMDRLANAIQKKDLKTVKKYLPEYSDHSAIDESTYKVFMATNPSMFGERTDFFQKKFQDLIQDFDYPELNQSFQFC